ncbi:hypothetical protein C8R47DRAFT_995709, partial [Mycena vitilis]
MVRSLSIALPIGPLEAWSDHVSLTLKVDRAVLNTTPRIPRVVRPPPVMPIGDPEMDRLCEAVMASRQNSAEMLRNLYGNVYVQTAYSQVYVHGCCKKTGTSGAAAVGSVFWGETSNLNCAHFVPGPEPPTSNRAAIYAVLLAVQEANPDASLMIFTSSEYTIRQLCYWAGKNSQIGWSCPNGDLLKDLTVMLRNRRAPTRFVRTERDVKNSRAEAAHKLAQ